ncbi:MAG: hypothetical protein ACOC7W_08710, partial [Desulfosalsimonas sp.]
AKQVEDVSEPWITQILNTLFEDEWRIRQSISPRHAMEMTFFRLFQIRPAMSIDELIEKIDLLRQGAAPRQPEKEPGGRPPLSAGAAGLQQAEAPGPDYPEPEPGVESEPAPSPQPDFEQTPPDTAEKTEQQEEKPDISSMSNQETWEVLKGKIAEKSPVLGACLADSTLADMDGKNLKIEVRSAGTNVNLLKGEKSISGIESICGQYLGKPVKVSLDIREAENSFINRKKEAKQLKEEALNHPLVGAAVKTFNGKIVDIKILPTGGREQ